MLCEEPLLGEVVKVNLEGHVLPQDRVRLFRNDQHRRGIGGRGHGLDRVGGVGDHDGRLVATELLSEFGLGEATVDGRGAREVSRQVVLHDRQTHLEIACQADDCVVLL